MPPLKTYTFEKLGEPNTVLTLKAYDDKEALRKKREAVKTPTEWVHMPNK